MKTNDFKLYPSRVEFMNSMRHPESYRAKELLGGHVLMHGDRVINWAGGFANLYPFIQDNGNKIAVKCWCADIDNAQSRFAKISAFLENTDSPYFVRTQFVPDALMVSGESYPVGFMDWVEGDSLKDYVDSQTPSKELFLDIAAKFLEMTKSIHQLNVSHGDLQHGNIMVLNGNLKLIDYDGMYVPGLDNMPDTIKGLPGYQHPARQKNKLLSPKSDFFSELVIYLSLLLFAEKPSMWVDYTDTEYLLFSAYDFADLNNSDIYKEFKDSSNPKVRLLFQRMFEALSVTDINELHPLEDLLGNQHTDVPLPKPITPQLEPMSTIIPNHNSDIIKQIDQMLEFLDNYMAAC